MAAAVQRSSPAPTPAPTTGLPTNDATALEAKGLRRSPTPVGRGSSELGPPVSTDPRGPGRCAVLLVRRARARARRARRRSSPPSVRRCCVSGPSLSAEAAAGWPRSRCSAGGPAHHGHPPDSWPPVVPRCRGVQVAMTCSAAGRAVVQRRDRGAHGLRPVTVDVAGLQDRGEGSDRLRQRDRRTAVEEPGRLGIARNGHRCRAAARVQRQQLDPAALDERPAQQRGEVLVQLLTDRRRGRERLRGRRGR